MSHLRSRPQNSIAQPPPCQLRSPSFALSQSRCPGAGHTVSFLICLSRSTCVCMLRYGWLLATPCTVACQAPLSMGFFRQEYWSGLPLPSPGDLPNSGIEPGSLTSPAFAGGEICADKHKLDTPTCGALSLKFNISKHMSPLLKPPDSPYFLFYVFPSER